MNALRRLLDRLAPVQTPEPSTLDRWDRPRALCMVLVKTCCDAA